MTDYSDLPTGSLDLTLTGCKVASLRANLLEGSAKLTFNLVLDDQMMDAKRALTYLAADKSDVDLQITEQQMRLPLRNKDAPPD